MDSKIKAKLVAFIENGQTDLALSFLKQIETIDGTYTDSQRNAAWLYMDRRAKELNDAGLEIQKVLKQNFFIPWTKDMVHDLLWIPIQKAMFGTSSMRSLKKKQVSDIHAVIERELAEKFGTDQIPFPSDIEKQMQNLSGVKMAQVNNLTNKDYAEYNGPPTI